MTLVVSGKRVIVIGGGAVGARKALKLWERGARVHIISPEVSGRLGRHLYEGEITWEERAYEEGDLEGAWLAVAATDDPALHAEIAREAEERRVWLNVASSPHLGTASMVASARQGGVRVSVDSGSPALSRALVAKIHADLSPLWADAARIMGELRGRIEGEEPKRRAFWRALAAALPDGAQAPVRWLRDAREASGVGLRDAQITSATTPTHEDEPETL